MNFIFIFANILRHFLQVSLQICPKFEKSENAANYFLLEKFVNITVRLSLIYLYQSAPFLELPLFLSFQMRKADLVIVYIV